MHNLNESPSQLGVVPQFDLSRITPKAIMQDLNSLISIPESSPHNGLLSKLLEQVRPVDFREQAELIDDSDKLQRKHYLVCTIEEVLHLAQANRWGLCRQNGWVYLYNGAFWKSLEEEDLQKFLGSAAEKMGVDKIDAQYHLFRTELVKQFFSAAHLTTPERANEIVLINLRNGTFEISPKRQYLRKPERADFLTYQLHFDYNPQAKAPMFQQYLDTVQPDPERQKVLAEYLGFIFTRNKTINVEKVLLLYGSGANGKSVFFDIVNALLGKENVSSYSLQNLTKHDGYQRAELQDKLVNYASEISGKLETATFKQLASGEPVEVRKIYEAPYTMSDYAKLIFNCNELPKDVEQTDAFFRRFLIVPFEVTVPEERQDKELSKKIIEQELSGVFNWVLAGLNRLLSQKAFSKCEAVAKQVEQYRRQSDTVQLFIEEEGYQKASTEITPLKLLYADYKNYCQLYVHKLQGNHGFSERLRKMGFVIERKNTGMAVFIKKGRV